MNNNKYIAYCDESHHNDGRYRAISLITFQYSDHLSFNTQVKKIIQESGISSEFKWTKLNSAREKFAAIKLIDFVLEKISKNKMRIDILYWDMEDYRHKNILHRDDNANLGRMYYKILNNVLNERWGTDKTWIIKPDEQSLINWNKLQDILTNSSKRSYCFDFENELLKNINHFNIQNIEESSSKKEVLIQIVDLFAGISIYSKDKYSLFQKWSEKQNPNTQLTLFSVDDIHISLSNADKYRCPVLLHLKEKIKSFSLKISFDSTKGLETRNPKEKLNFWFYQPQHHLDKAPKKPNKKFNNYFIF